MSKFLLFYLVWMLTGNPILAIILILVIYYFIDRRFIGLLPSVTKPFRRMRRVANLRRQLAINPHDKPAQHYLAQAYMDQRRYRAALELLEKLPASMQGEADVLYDTGACHLMLGNLDQGEELVLRALDQQPGLRQGEPYLRLATAIIGVNPERSLALLKEFQTRNFSSCESYYRMAQLYRQSGDGQSARVALQRCLDTYHSLPRFRKRVERRWAFLARINLLTSR